MVKKIISVATAFLMLCCMIPFGVFADDVLEDCPKCGKHTYTKFQDFSMSTSDFSFPIALKKRYCSSCDYTYYEWNCLGMTGYKDFDNGGYSLIVDYLHEWADNTFGKNATATKFTPGGGSTSGSGAGRKDLPGYADDNGTPAIGSTGIQAIYAEPFGISTNPSGFDKNPPKGCITGASGSGTSFKPYYQDNSVYTATYYFVAPVTGLYYVGTANPVYKHGSLSAFFDSKWNALDFTFTPKSAYEYSITLTKGESCYLNFWHWQNNNKIDYKPYKYTMSAVPVFVDPLGDSNINNYNKITINNNTWNGNIYQDNSTNLTYIYPEYTTINENGDTVTNISTNPIIYNNEEHKYYTYDTVTNNFYYISYGTSDPSATPTPKPTFKPGGGSSRGGGVSRHHGDDGTNEEDWYKSYYILNDYDYDCYYGNFYVDDGQGNTYGKSKTRVSTTAIPIADGTYKVTVPDDINWRAWRWDADAKMAVPVNSEAWKSTMYYDFYASEDIIFEFRKIDGSQIKPKEIILRLDNPTIVEYEPGGKKHEYNPDPIYPDEQSYIIPQMNSNNFPDSHGTWIATGSTKYSDQYDYYKAFDRSTSTGWCMGNGSGGKGGRELPCYVQITIPDPQNYYINGYVIRGHKSDEYPGAWILQASTDGTDWEDLDTQTAQDLSDFKEHSYDLAVHKAYKYYRVKVTAYPNNYMGIGCFNLLGYNAEDVIIPTPTPSPEPTSTPSPAPTATPTPGGGTVPTPGGDSSGGNSSNISGGDDEGLFGWIWDLLKDIVKSILKAIFKIIANILGFLIWIVERVGLLLPFLPGPAVAALGAGVVLVFVIRIIRFIRG